MIDVLAAVAVVERRLGSSRDPNLALCCNVI